MRHDYFEGWYFKQSAGSAGGIWSFIPGIAKGGSEESGYSFVQVIEGQSGKSWWFQYEIEDFHAATKGLDIVVGPNRFGKSGIKLDLSDGKASIRASFAFGPFTTVASPPWSPGVMGPFSFVPFMECRHGLVSLDHLVSGFVETEGRRVEIPEGRGYIEKDWGRSMPESWIWTQCNDFPERGDSVMLSIATIPWLGSSFRGFLCVARIGGRTLSFTTYNGARIAALTVSDAEVRCALVRGTEKLELVVTRTRGGILRAPVRGLLSRRIAEAVDARMELRLVRSGRVMAESASAHAGLETAGDTAGLCSGRPAGRDSRGGTRLSKGDAGG